MGSRFPRRAAGRRARGAAFAVGNLDSLSSTDGELDELFARFPEQPDPEPYDPAPSPAAAHAGHGARLEPVAPADVLPARDRRQRRPSARRAGDLLDVARRLDGLAAVRRDPRAARTRLLGALVAHAYADVPVLQLSAGLESSKCIEAYRRMREIVTELREQGPPRTRSSALAHTPPARARSRLRTVVPWRGTRRNRRSSTARTSIPIARSSCSTGSRSTRS